MGILIFMMRKPANICPFFLDTFIFIDYYGHGMKEYNFFQSMKFVVMNINSIWTSFWTFANRRNRRRTQCECVIIISMYYIQINVSKYPQSMYLDTPDMIQISHMYCIICFNPILQMIFKESDYIKN